MKYLRDDTAARLSPRRRFPEAKGAVLARGGDRLSVLRHADGENTAAMAARRGNISAACEIEDSQGRRTIHHSQRFSIRCEGEHPWRACEARDLPHFLSRRRFPDAEHTIQAAGEEQLAVRSETQTENAARELWSRFLFWNDKLS